MIKKLNKLNTVVKKYQPMIQTVGIVLILITVILTWLQISIARKESAFNEQSRAYDFSAGWRIQFIKSETNALIDELAVSPANEDYNVQKIRVHILDGINPYQFESVGSTISTGAIKARLSTIYKRHYDLQNLDCPGCFEDDSYPVAMTIFYERFGSRDDTTILYNYHFKTYFSRTSIRFKSQGCEFVKYIAKDSASLAREQISYNLSSSFLANVSDGGFQIRLAMALKDPVLKPAIDYAYSNVKVYRSSFVLVDKKGGDQLGKLVLMMPLPLYDSMAIEEKSKVVAELNDKIDLYDETITSAILNIQDFEKSFRSVKGQTHLDSLRGGRTIIVNQEQWEKWAKMNSELVNLITKRIKI